MQSWNFNRACVSVVQLESRRLIVDRQWWCTREEYTELSTGLVIIVVKLIILETHLDSSRTTCLFPIFLFGVQDGCSKHGTFREA